jgi:omega-hydroxy-beta-dihydromenaquinone-9 sulfotransferase
MAWRERVLQTIGPGLLAGVTFGNWVRLLRENRFVIDPPYWLRAQAITTQSLVNATVRRHEERTYLPQVMAMDVPPPLFILGHWRSGTTHLHHLLAADQRFAYPNVYQTSYPHTFLTTESRSAWLVGAMLPPTRPMDNVRQAPESPNEDEFAVGAMTFRSPCIGWVFPRRAEHYDRYLTFRGVPEREVAEWKQALVSYLKKLTWRYGRPLLLKSPPHTCRVKLLLDLFPEARFVHIHRNPLTVYQSTRHTLSRVFRLTRLQGGSGYDAEDSVLRRYREMYDAFFEERGLIPEGRYCEVGFEALEADPIGQVRRVYEALGLPDFGGAEPDLRAYVGSLSGFEKNRFPGLPAGVRDRVAGEWRRSFQEWGYSV